MLLVILAALAAVLCETPARADWMSKEQGDTIINELRQIRRLLEKQPAAAAPTAPAAPEKVRLKLGAENAIGRSDAPVVMVEYTDYQCPFCNRFTTTTFPELKKSYIDTGKLRFVTRDLPLPFHQHALKAAQATRCGGEQGKFWQLKDVLIRNSDRLTPDLITALAREAALDMTAFKTCMESDRHLAEIRESSAAAQGIGINGTPSFVVGRMNGEYLDGVVVVGAQPIGAFAPLIDELLAKGGNK
jgi:protein-disulfide isomerase